MKPAVSDVIIKMIDISDGNRHDISHFLNVYSYAKTIGEKEGLDEESQYVLEVAAVLHDIACPLCRKKYGRADGRMQEIEGEHLSADFLNEISVPETFAKRIVWLVSHHHTYSDVELIEHRILLEADFLVNAAESGYKASAIKAAKDNFFRTETGKHLLNTIFAVARAGDGK